MNEGFYINPRSQPDPVRVRSNGFRLEPHGTVDIKGKGPMETYFLLGRR